MRNLSLVFILLISYFGLLLRLYINNIFLISFIASLIYGILISKKIITQSNNSLLIYFFSSFTTFSGFIAFFYEVIVKREFFKFFFLINIVVIANIMIMFIGFFIGKGLVNKYNKKCWSSSIDSLKLWTKISKLIIIFHLLGS